MSRFSATVFFTWAVLVFVALSFGGQVFHSSTSSGVLVTAAKAGKNEDPKACEVCVKVLEDMEAKFLTEKKDKKNKEKIENGIAKYCKNKELGPKEKKICYYLEPIKRLVSQPFSLGMPKKKVCEKLKKTNPEICEVKYPMKVDSNIDVSKLRVKELKKILSDRGIECKGCTEKQDYVKRVEETAHMDEL